MEYEKLLSKSDAWSVAEAVDLLLGMKPLRAGEPDPSKDLRELAYRAIDAGALSCVGKSKHRMVRPADFIAWAAGKGWNIPPRILALLDDCPPTPIKRDPAPEPPPEPPEVKPRPTRRVAWIAELIRSWPEIARAYSDPSPVHVMAWLKDHGAPDVFPKDQPNRNSLTWMKEDGRTRAVPQTRVGTVISELRGTGEIPPRNN